MIAFGFVFFIICSVVWLWTWTVMTGDGDAKHKKLQR